MAKIMKRTLVLCMILVLGIGTITMPAMAEEIDGTLPTEVVAEDLQTDAVEEEPAEIPAPQNYSPALRVEMAADKAEYETGETITWTVTIRNVSFFTAHDVVVTDELTDDVWVIGALYPGAALSFGATTEHAQEGTIWNTVVARWEDGDEIPNAEEPEETKSAGAQAAVTVKNPTPPSSTVVPDTPHVPAAQGDEIDIFDEDVPLADVPLTGDLSALWMTLSSISIGGILLLRRKRKEDEE